MEVIVTDKKHKLKIILGLTLTFAIILSFFLLRTETIEEAMEKADIRFNEIVYKAEYLDSIMILYTTPDTLSAGQLKRNLLGYKWVLGGGSGHFEEEDDATWSITNFTPEPNSLNNISLAKGVVHNSAIQQMTLHFEREDVEATFIPYGGVRIWYAFSKAPIPGMPDVTIVYEDGMTKSGWY